MGNPCRPRATNARTQRKKPTHQASNDEAPGRPNAAGKERHGCSKLLGFPWVTVVVYLTTIALSVFVACGCVSSNSAIDGLYLANISTNDTLRLSLRVGYFGGCVSVSNTTQQSNSSFNNSSSSLQTQCVPNMRGNDVDALSEQLGEQLGNLSQVSGAQGLITTSLKTTLLPEAKHLQNDVFFWEPLIVHIVLFVLSGAMLFVALMASSQKRRYKAVLAFAAGLEAFAQGLALVIVIGSLQALNATLGGDGSQIEQDISSSHNVSRGRLLDRIQAVLAVFTALSYLFMGGLFVIR